ncbi:GIY-YIG nuclease family protein [Streptomyces sp. NPDC046978]|uniref:GIY-YIG nuclease family protein n=1 Tax=unclassified Streptomyces TaxID=2593676 RepID=UPI0033F9736B
MIEERAAARQCSYGACRTVATTPAPLRFCSEHETEAASLLGPLAGTLELEKYLHSSPRTRARKLGSAPGQVCFPGSHLSVVYYARRPPDRLIKIGTSTSLKQRMKGLSLLPLAVEPGDNVREKQMHRRFEHLRVTPRGEWFHPGPDLIAYIREIRRREGIPRL